jgi:hypothetical protein
MLSNRDLKHILDSLRTRESLLLDYLHDIIDPTIFKNKNINDFIFAWRIVNDKEIQSTFGIYKYAIDIITLWKQSQYYNELIIVQRQIKYISNNIIS